MIATDHHGPPKGNSGRGASSLSVSADSASRTSPDLPACYGGRMSADKIVKTFFHVHGPVTKTTFLVSEVIGYAVGPNNLVVYFQGGATISFDGFNSNDEVSDLAARIQTAMEAS